MVGTHDFILFDCREDYHKSVIILLDEVSLQDELRTSFLLVCG
jgi:tRNA U38,U39,U40 pseudouridine synthase TruA